LLRQLRGGITNRTLNRILSLKKSLEQMYESIRLALLRRCRGAVSWCGVRRGASRGVICSFPRFPDLGRGSGAYEALEEVQADDDVMAMMYLTAVRDGKHAPGFKGTHCNVMQVCVCVRAREGERRRAGVGVNQRGSNQRQTARVGLGLWCNPSSAFRGLLPLVLGMLLTVLVSIPSW